MVCLAIRTFRKTRPVCYAKPLIRLAYVAIENGNMYEAGCLLREAMSRFLHALCECYDCLPEKKKRRTPACMAKALLKTGGMDESGYEWAMEVINFGNRLAHCKYVKESLVDTALGMLGLMIKYSLEIDCPEWRRGGAV